MNERIRELAQQAFCYSCEFAQGTDYNPHNPYNLATQKTRYDEKFAELIIAKCVAQCEFVAGQAGITNTGEMARKTKATADNCAFWIKEYFGVEE